MTDIRIGHKMFKHIENHGMAQLEFILKTVQMAIDGQELVVKNATPNDAVKHERPLLLKLEKEKQKVVDAIKKIGIYNIGSRVSHPKYGIGWVCALSNTTQTIYTVQFDKQSETGKYLFSELTPEPKMINYPSI